MISQVKKETLPQLPHIRSQRELWHSSCHMPVTVAKEMGQVGWPGLRGVEWLPLS